MNGGEWIYQFTGVTLEILKKVFLSLLLFFGLWLVRVSVRKVLSRVRDGLSRYDLNCITMRLLMFVGVMLLGWIWFSWFKPWVIFTGLLIAATIVALKEILIDLAGWIYLVWRRPMEVGDWVTVGDINGEVYDLDYFRISLLETSGCELGKQRTGRIVQLPNSRVFRESLVNYTKGYRYIWNECAVHLTFDSNWQKAKEMLLQIVNRYIETINQNNDPRMQRAIEGCFAFYNKMAPELYTQVSEEQIVITVRFLCESDQRRITLHAIWEDVLQEFEQCDDIQFSYVKMPGYDQLYENQSAISSTSAKLSHGPM